MQNKQLHIEWSLLVFLWSVARERWCGQTSWEQRMMQSTMILGSRPRSRVGVEMQDAQSRWCNVTLDARFLISIERHQTPIKHWKKETETWLMDTTPRFSREEPCVDASSEPGVVAQRRPQRSCSCNRQPGARNPTWAADLRVLGLGHWVGRCRLVDGYVWCKLGWRFIFFWRKVEHVG